MIVYFADRQLNIIGQASTGLPKGLVISDDLKTEDVETGIAVFDCKIHYTKDTQEKAKEITTPGNYLLRKNGDEYELYSITEREGNTKKQQYYIYAEDDGLDLLNEVVGKYEADKAYPIDHYINKYAAGAGFEIGINEAKNLTRKLSWDGESTASARIASIATRFDGCEVSYSFSVDGLNVAKKYINIYKERGKDVGTTLRLNYDIDSIITTESVANLATALQCTGGTPEDENYEDDVEPQPITLKGYKYDDGDFYVDSDGILKSRVALKKWARLLWKTDDAQQAGGHITRQYSYDTLSQETLCSHAITELKKYRDMEVNYEVEIKKFPDGVKIGDRVNIVDDMDELYLSARVLLLKSSVADKEHKVTIGEYLIKPSGIHQKVMELAAQFTKVAQSAARALQIANSAKAAADNAQKQADSALEDAENAQQAADEAANAADNAAQSAEQAQQAANDAQQAVDKVEQDVSDMEQTIADAKDAAEQARQAAQTAQAKAEEARQSAVNAQEKAEETESALAETKEKAESAITKSEEAKTSAEQAVKDAKEAATTAAAARQDAEQAKEDINSLGKNLTTLENTMSVDFARKTDLTETEANLQTQISQNAAEIRSTATKFQIIDETTNNAAELAAKAQAEAVAAQEEADRATAEAEAAQSLADDATSAAEVAQAEAVAAQAAAETAHSVADKAEADLAAAEAELEALQNSGDATLEEISAAAYLVAQAQKAANAALSEAEAAVSAAEAAQVVANDAVASAEAAQAEANEAWEAAEMAQKVADEANGAAVAADAAMSAAIAAGIAQSTADTAKTNADRAQAQADEAAQKAQDALAAAQTAATQMERAEADLAEAEQRLANVLANVDSTQEEVEAAYADVEVAQKSADEATVAAEAARAEANKANANAAAARVAAAEAKAAAEAAQEAAETAINVANQVQADVNKLAVRITNAQTEIKQNSEQIALRATKTEVAETLGGYSTKQETEAAIKVEADAITTSVNAKYEGLEGSVSTTLKVLQNEVSMNFTTTTEQISDVDGDMQSKFEELYKHISFSENGIHIGGSSRITLNVDNDDGITFSKNGVPFGKWDGNDFYTGNIVVRVNERAQLGNFAFVPRSDGSLSFLKVTDEYAAIVITEQPKNMVTAVDMVTTITITAIGEGLTYQWEMSSDRQTWDVMSTNQTLTIRFTHAGRRWCRCKITDAFGNTLVSDVATIEIQSDIL